MQASIDSPLPSQYTCLNEVYYSLENEYIFEIAALNGTVAVSGSTHQIKLYNGIELKHILSLAGHSQSVSKIQFDTFHPSMLYSSSQDGSVRCWDLRASPSCVQFWQLPDHQAAMSHAFNHSSNILAVGSKLVDPDAFIHFFDLRSSKLMTSFSESMSDDVTQLTFHPEVPNRLLSGSADGIACIFDLVKWDEDEDLIVSMPAGISINKLGWFGPSYEYVWLATHAETFSLWSCEGDSLNSFGDIRQYSSNLTPIDYIVTCFLCPKSRQLSLVTGSNTGDMSIFDVQIDNLSFTSTLTRGHTDIVRDAAIDWSNQVLYTGGEDAKLISWGTKEHKSMHSIPSLRRKPETNHIFGKVKESFSPYRR